MTREEFNEALRGCTESLAEHRTRGVRERMQEIADSPLAELRGDSYGRGGVVTQLEQEVAEMFGKEAAVFMPSGTMAQQIALRIWSDRAGSRRVAFHPTCHLELHEHHGYRELHHLEGVLLGDSDRLLTLTDLESVVPPAALLLEFPQREIGGQLPTWEEFQEIVAYCREHEVRLHLDGARLWECQPYFGRSYREIVADFDSVYVSFYKALFGLAGSILTGPEDFIAEARIWMRRHGGNLVNMFPNAIAGKIGMDLRLPRIPAYVARAAEVAAICRELPGIKVVPDYPPTNMMHLHFDSPPEKVMDAVGEIALSEKCALLYWVRETDGGCMTELHILDAGIQIPIDRVRMLLGKFSRMLG